MPSGEPSRRPPLDGDHAGILLITINHSYAGFFAYVTFVINQLIFAEKRGLLPVVYFGPTSGDGPNAFYDPARGDNTWDYYFEPVAGWTFGQIREWLRSPASPIAPRDVVQLSREELWYLHREDPDSVYNYPYGYHHAHDGDIDAWYAAQRAKAHRYIERYITVRPEIQAGVDQYVRDAFGSRVVGVHMRGTDKGGAGSVSAHLMKIVPPSTYFPLIDRRLDEWGGGQVFLATDQRQFVEIAKARYGDRLLTLDVIRSRTPVNPFQVSDSKNYLKGLEVLRDCLLLSRTDFLLKCTSAVGEYAMYFNPALESLDVNHLQSKPTRWDTARVTWNRAKSMSWEGLGRTDLGSWRTLGVRYVRRNPLKVIVRETIEQRRYSTNLASRCVAIANDLVVWARRPKQLPLSTIRYRAASAHRRRGARLFEPEHVRSCRYLEIRLNQPGSAPLFVQLTRVFEQLHFAEAHHLIPVVALDQPDNRYRDPSRGPNVWDYYFEPAAGDTVSDLDRVPPGEIALLSFRMQQQLVLGPGLNVPARSDLDEAAAGRFLRRRDVGAHLAQMYMRIRQTLRDRADRFYREHLDGSPTIGIHIEDAESMSPQPMRMPLEMYSAAIGALLSRWPSARLFVSANDTDGLARLTDRYGAAIVPSPRAREAMDRRASAERGVEAGAAEIVDALLLARAAVLIHAGAPLAEFATFFNPALDVVDLRSHGVAAADPNALGQADAAEVL